MPSVTIESMLLLPHGPLTVEWRRSPRARRVSLRIDPRGGGVVITLPPRAGESAGRALLLDHAGWVADRLARLPAPLAFRDGAEIPVDGRPVRIVHAPNGRGTRLVEGALHVAGDAAFLQRRVGDFLRSEARRRLAAIATAKAAAHRLRIGRVVVKDTQSRWGSCTAAGVLMFSWRLVMAPPPVQDYVVGHEVAHLRHMDHSRQFWALVEEMTPHREAATRWLERHGAGLMRVG